MKNFFCLLLISALSNLRVCGQVILQPSQPLPDTSVKQYTDNSRYLKPAALIIPGTFLVYGGLKAFVTGIQRLDDTIYSNIKRNHPGFHTTAENYLMWAPSASIYFLDALKVKTRHSFKEHLILDAGSIVITGGIGYAMRIISRNINAYTTHDTKFPSGHTANAFRGAEILHQELKDNNQILSYSGYLIATSVGIIRLYNKDHLLSEVVAGAGLGILSTKLTYWIFDRVKRARNPKLVPVN
jgi:membrane-associated phospholipid phosphatase